MAISILSTTHNDIITAGSSGSVSIPATTVGSTLIVLISIHAGNSGFPPVSDIEDDENIGGYTRITSAAGKVVPSFAEYNEIYYRSSVPAGLTTINVFLNISNIRLYVTVIEASGVNTASPVETSNFKSATATTSNPKGTSITTAFTNALFVGTGTSTTSTWSGLNNSWTRVDGGSSDHAQGYKIASGSQQMSINSSNVSQTYCVSTAIFNPTANAYTLSLSETTTLADTDLNEADYTRSLSDSFSLADAFDGVLSTLAHFKTLMDSVTLSVTIALVATYIRSLQETLLVIDSITFVHNIFRTKTDEVRLQDWLSIKKTTGNWGD